MSRTILGRKGSGQSNLPAVSILRGDVSVSFRADVVEDVVTGRVGSIRLLGGPAFHGKVREADPKPLRQFVVPEPADRTPAQLERRRAVGQAILGIARASEAVMNEKKWAEGEEVEIP